MGPTIWIAALQVVQYMLALAELANRVHTDLNKFIMCHSEDDRVVSIGPGSGN